MSKATPEAVQAVFHPDSLCDEVAHLNRLLDDSNLTISCLFQLLRDHNIHVGSTELIKAREKVEVEMRALRTANAGLVEKVKRLEEVGDGLAEIAGKFGHGLFVHERKDAWNQAKGQP